MKIKWKARANTEKNDCWLDALSLASSKTREQIKEEFKHLVESDGGLGGHYLRGYLQQLGFNRYEYDRSDKMTVREIMVMYNHYDNYMLINTHENEEYNHTFYVHKGIIHDNPDVEERSEYLNSIVVNVWLKEVN